MAYYNRRQLLEATLQSINKTTYKNYEIIVVDDASREDQKIDDFVEKYNIKLLKITKQEKNHINPCVAFNKGFQKATGDIVIIQNPECVHLGDIVSHSLNLKENEYYAYHCYSLNERRTESYINGYFDFTFMEKSHEGLGDDGFYCHKKYRPQAYHFCTCINKKDLDELNGFDERYAYGNAYDDDEFLLRIKRKNLQIKFIEKPMVLHLYHYSEPRNKGISNYNLYNNITCLESKIKANETVEYEKIYSNIFNLFKNYNLNTSISYKKALDFYNEISKIKIVNIGSGKGKLEKALLEIGKSIEITSCDLNNFLDDEVKNKTNFVKINLSEPNTLDVLGSFDILFCMDVLEHIEEKHIDKILEQFSRISKNVFLTIANHSEVINNIQLHLIQKPKEHWNSLIEKYFFIKKIEEAYDKRLIIYELLTKTELQKS